MRRYALLICLILSIAIGGHAFAGDDDDSAAAVEVLSGDDDSAPALAEVSAEEAVEAVEDVVEAAQSKNWALGLSGLLTLIIFAFRRFNLLSKIPPQHLPAVAVALGVAGDLAHSLSTGGAVSTTGAVIGLASIGVWEVLLKHLLKTKKPEAQPAVTE